MDRVKQDFDRYMSEKSSKNPLNRIENRFSVAYLTAECGIADCLPIYSGGLGILSGDHLKSASDLNLPITGVSLAYQRGYFDYPKKVGIRELADLFKISPSTLSESLRRGQRKIMQRYMEAYKGSRRPPFVTI